MPYQTLIADILMIAAALGAAIYCMVLSRRLSRLSSFDKGIGGAIAVLSAQVDEMKAALAEARSGSDGAVAQLRDLNRQARDIAGELELMIAACHDFAEQAITVQANGPAQAAASPLAASLGIGEARVTDATIPIANPVAAAPSVVPEAAPDTDAPTPIFGTRRALQGQPVFRRHGQG